MKKLLILAGLLAVSGCVFEPVAPPTTPPATPEIDPNTGTFFRTSPSDPFCTEEVDARTGQIVSRICA